MSSTGISKTSSTVNIWIPYRWVENVKVATILQVIWLPCNEVYHFLIMHVLVCNIWQFIFRYTLFVDNLSRLYQENQTYILSSQKCIYLFSFESWFFLNYWPVVKIVKKPPTRYHLLLSIFNLFQRKWNLISTQTHSNSTNENNLNVIASKTHKLQTRFSFFKNALILCSLHIYVVVQLVVNVTELLIKS